MADSKDKKSEEYRTMVVIDRSLKDRLDEAMWARRIKTFKEALNVSLTEWLQAETRGSLSEDARAVYALVDQIINTASPKALSDLRGLLAETAESISPKVLPAGNKRARA